MELMRKKYGGVDFVDITIVILILMSWVFMANAWKDPLANTMLAISAGVLSFYLISRYTGALSFLELTKPFWTLSALASIPIWYLTFVILPQPGGSLAKEQIIPNMIEYFIDPNTAYSILQALFASTEAIFAGILLAFFIGVGKKRAGSARKQRLNIIAVILLISIFMSLLHISFAVKLAQAGVYQPGVLFGHQILSFGIRLIIAVVFPFIGMVALIAPQIVKDLIATNAPASVWFGFFLLFVVLDIMSWFFAKKKERTAYGGTFNNFVK